MTASGFLPQITQPTRITETTMTGIDNIYTNSFTNNIHSRSLLLEIANHLGQFDVQTTEILVKQIMMCIRKIIRTGMKRVFLTIYPSKIGKMICKMSIKTIMNLFGIRKYASTDMPL